MQADHRFVSFLLRWHGLWRCRKGMDGLRRTVAQLQGVDLPVSDLENAIFGARLADYSPLRLDRLIDTGEIVWQGRQAVGEHDGLLAVYLGPDFPLLGRISVFASGHREGQIRSLMLSEESLEFERLTECLGGFPDELLRSLWKLAWNGEATSSSLAALRARQSSTASRYHRRPRPRYTTRRHIPPGASGRWRLLSGPRSGFASETDRRSALARQLLDRYGIVCRSLLAGESLSFDELLPLFEQLEAIGAARRRQLLETADAVQFIAPGAEELWRDAEGHASAGMLAACDPANPFGALIPWPEMERDQRPQRLPGARVLIDDGILIAYLTRAGRRMYTPAGLGDRGRPIQLLKRSVAGNPLFLESINGQGPYATPWHRDLVRAGFSPSSRGYLFRPAS